MRVFSGVQPTGFITLGNYLGAIKNFVSLQDEGECFYCVVNLHSITVPRDPEDLIKKTLDITATYLACGLDHNKAVLFAQADVDAHSVAGWLLQCVARIGELNRMIQFKEKSKGSEEVVCGLYTYPVLQAADILLYNATHVPVGLDQKQHLELTKTIAKRFNRDYSSMFNLPEAIIGAEIKGLDNPSKKMSKSATSEYNHITLLDDPVAIAKKIKKAVTDSENKIYYDEEKKLGVSNLLKIQSLVSNLSIAELEKKYINQGYGVWKKELIELLVDHLTSIQKKFSDFRKDEDYLKDVLAIGSEKASKVANYNLNKMKEAMGLKYK